MDAAALQTLSPEERQALREALGQEEQDPIAALAGVLELLASKLEALEERQTKLESVVVDEIIGGISGLYNDNMRLEGIKGLKGKYADLFGPHEGAFQELYGGDVYEKLFDMLEELKGGEGFTDELGDSKIKEIATQLQEKLSKVKGSEKPAEPVAAELEVKTEAKEPDPLEGVRQGIMKMKKRGRVPGMMGESRE
jgi:hypothetical protein